MKLLIFLVVINSIGLLAIYLLYKFFNWLLIEKNLPSGMDRSLCKPNFFARESKKLAEKDLKDQDKFTLTEISNGTQMFDKTIQNDTIDKDILIYDSKRAKS